MIRIRSTQYCRGRLRPTPLLYNWAGVPGSVQGGSASSVYLFPGLPHDLVKCRLSRPATELAPFSGTVWVPSTHGCLPPAPDHHEVIAPASLEQPEPSTSACLSDCQRHAISEKKEAGVQSQLSMGQRSGGLILRCPQNRSASCIQIPDINSYQPRESTHRLPDISRVRY